MNRINLDACEFTNPITGDKSKGFKVWDDYGKAYHNCFESIPKDNLELFELAIETEEMELFFETMEENKQGIFINDTWYDFEEVMKGLKHICYWTLEIAVERFPSRHPKGCEESHSITACCKCGNKLSQDEIEERLNELKDDVNGS